MFIVLANELLVETLLASHTLLLLLFARLFLTLPVFIFLNVWLSHRRLLPEPPTIKHSVDKLIIYAVHRQITGKLLPSG